MTGSHLRDGRAPEKFYRAVETLKRRNPEFPRRLDPTGKLRRFQKRQPADPQLAHARVSNATCVAADDPRIAK